MDDQTFDRLVAAMARRPTRRITLRLLGGGLLSGLFLRHGGAVANAVQRSDRDDDGLYDDDEVEVYGTNPDVYDTDGDGVGDGEEVYVGTDPLSAPPAPGGSETGLPDGSYDAAPPAYVDPVDSCAIQGLTDCGGFCVDLSSSLGNCGACGVYCGIDGACQNGICTRTECASGLTRCGDSFCLDLFSDPNNCGGCGAACGAGLACCRGVCVDLYNDINNCGYCGHICMCSFACETGDTCQYGQCI